MYNIRISVFFLNVHDFYSSVRNETIRRQTVNDVSAIIGERVY